MEGVAASAEGFGAGVAGGADCAGATDGVVWGGVCEGGGLFAVASEEGVAGALSVGMGALAAGEGAGGLGDVGAGVALVSEVLCVELVAGMVAAAFLTAIFNQSKPPRFQCM